jgi:hypothetical protein
MIDIVTTLKHRARALQRRAAEGDQSALQRLGALAQEPSDIKRRHCLSALATP